MSWLFLPPFFCIFTQKNTKSTSTLFLNQNFPPSEFHLWHRPKDHSHTQQIIRIYLKGEQPKLQRDIHIRFHGIESKHRTKMTPKKCLQKRKQWISRSFVVFIDLLRSVLPEFAQTFLATSPFAHGFCFPEINCFKKKIAVVKGTSSLQNLFKHSWMLGISLKRSKKTGGWWFGPWLEGWKM